MDIIYTLIRADRKSIAIKIGDGGEVIVRAPRRMNKNDIDAVVQRHEAWIEKHRLKAIMRSESLENISADKEAVLREAAKKHLEALTREFSEITGLRPAAVKIGSAKKRFGSCSSAGNITYSYLLMLYPAAAIEYVVLHEICHLRFMDHSKNFYALIERYMPEWRERKKLLSIEYRKRADDVRDICR